jgi:hypothetical protein
VKIEIFEWKEYSFGRRGSGLKVKENYFLWSADFAKKISSMIFLERKRGCFAWMVPTKTLSGSILTG